MNRSTHPATIDVSARVNGARIFGELIFPAGDGKPTYEGDVEQCDDCGCDIFRVVKIDHPSGLASFTGYALHCGCCGSVYYLKSEEG